MTNISVVNHTNGRISDARVQKVLRAINRQIKEDFEPYWSMSAELRLEGRSVSKPSEVKHPDLRGDAIIYLWDKVSEKESLGYHTLHFKGIPYSFVFIQIADQIGESWTVTLSHEALEMIADPEVNLWVEGPNPKYPKNPKKNVLFWYEVCDAVQADTYTLDGIEVSNFVLPLYFTSQNEFEGRNDFLGKMYAGRTLRSFGVNPGGYMDYIDPRNRTEGSIFGGKTAERRMKIKEKGAGKLRRGARYLKNFQSLVIKKKSKKRKRKRPSRSRAARRRR